MKALAIVMLVLGVIALGVFGLMQFRNIGEYEEEVARREERDPAYSKADQELLLAESRDMLDLQKHLRLGGALGATIFLVGGALLLRRSRKS